MNQFGMSAGNSQNAIRNLIFMAEDASSVWGTQGLSGVLRASANNLTMVAMGFGPVAMGATVAATSIAQLALAFTKNKDNAKLAAAEVDNYKDSLDRLTRRSQENAAFAVDFGKDFDVESLRSKLADANAVVEESERRLQDLADEQAKLRATRVFIESDAGGGDAGRQAYDERVIAVAEEQRKIAEQLNKARVEGEQIRARIVRLTKSERDQQVFVRESLKQTNQVAEEVENNRLRQIEERAKAEHEAERSRNLEASKNRFHRLVKQQAQETKTIEQEVNEIVKQRLHSQQVEAMVASKLASIDKTRLGIEQERSRVQSQLMSASQVVAQTQSSIAVDRDAAIKKQNILSSMSKRDRMGYQIAERRAMEAKGNNRGRFQDRRNKEAEKTNQLLETMIRDGLKTNAGAATAG